MFKLKALRLFFLITVFSNIIVFNAIAEMDVYDAEGVYLGILIESGTTIKIYNQNEAVKANYAIEDDGYLEFFGPFDTDSATIYFTTGNCTGTPYVYKQYPYGRLFSQICKNSSNPIDATDSDNFYINRRVTQQNLTFSSRVTYIEDSSCGTCLPVNETVNGNEVYYIDTLPFSALDVDFEYPVPTPVYYEYKPVILENTDQKVTSLEVDDLNVNQTLTSEGQNILGTVSADSADIEGAVSAGSADIEGAITAESASIDNHIIAGSAGITGAVTAGSANVTGAVEAGSASIDGAVTANSGTFSTLTVNSTLTAKSNASVKNLTVESSFESKDVSSSFQGNIVTTDNGSIIAEGAVRAENGLTFGGIIQTLDGTVITENGVGYFKEMRLK